MAEQSLRATQKVRFINLETLEERLLQFNPIELSHGASAEYTRHPVVGMSNQPMQYANTTNRQFSFTTSFKVERPVDKTEYEETMKFLDALMYPLAPGASPPDVLFVWPNLVSVPVKVVSVNPRHIQFNAELAPTRTDVDITLERIRDRPLLYGEVRERGWNE